jgi:Kinesin motor domain
VHACSRESVAINASLMTLGRCLEALRWNQQHPAAEQRLVPYREARVSPFFMSMSQSGHHQVIYPKYKERVYRQYMAA